MDVRRGFKQIAASLLAGTCLFMGASAMSPSRTDMGPVPHQEVASADPEVAVAVADPITTTSTTAPPAFVFPTAPEQWFAPGGRNQGTEGLARFLAAVALRDNAPLYISEEWGRTTGPDTSDHNVARTDSWAADVAVRGIQVPTVTTETAARRIAAALGVPDWPGGDLTKTVNGYRFQILWKVDGHFNHVHIGVRKNL
jgi:hypothetical protein